MSATRNKLIGRIELAFLLAASLAGAPAAQENNAAGQGAGEQIGLAVGVKAPSFSAMDQFGNEQSLETLKGTNGTVLLMFRSADW